MIYGSPLLFSQLLRISIKCCEKKRKKNRSDRYIEAIWRKSQLDFMICPWDT